MSWKKILKGKSGIAYSAIVLDEASRQQLLALDIPDGWKPYAHHMTIRMGSLKEDSQYTVGEEIKLNMTGVGRDEKAMAVTVDGVREDGKFFPHITVAVSQMVNHSILTRYHQKTLKILVGLLQV